jgi:hypothetical protein
MRTAYSDFSKSVGLLTRNERTQAYGFDRSISAKAVWARKNYEKELDKYKQVRYNDDGTVVVTDDMTDKVHYSAPPHFKPNAILDVRAGQGDNSQINRTFYDENGEPKKRIDSGNHGNAKRHPFEPHGAHRHDRIQTEKGEEWDKGQPINFNDVTENADIL